MSKQIHVYNFFSVERVAQTTCVIKKLSKAIKSLKSRPFGESGRPDSRGHVFDAD
jgi:hypothetical protein